MDSPPLMRDHIGQARRRTLRKYFGIRPRDEDSLRENYRVVDNDELYRIFDAIERHDRQEERDERDALRREEKERLRRRRAELRNLRENFQYRANMYQGLDNLIQRHEYSFDHNYTLHQLADPDTGAVIEGFDFQNAARAIPLLSDLTHVRGLMRSIVNNIQHYRAISRNPIAIGFTGFAVFEHAVTGEVFVQHPHSRPGLIPVLMQTTEADIKALITQMLESIDGALDVMMDSRRFKCYCGVSLRLQVNNPRIGRSYLEDPEFLRNKKATINIQNNDDMCFFYSVMCALHFVNDPEKRNTKNLFRVNQHQALLEAWCTENKTTMNSLQPPTPRDLPDMELLFNISLNVYILPTEVEVKECNDKISLEDLQPFYTTHNPDAPESRFVNLIMLREEEKSSEKQVCDEKTHYVVIKDLCKLFNTVSKDSHRIFMCHFCRTTFSSHDTYQKHIQDDYKSCRSFIRSRGEFQTMDKMPEKHANCKFYNYKSMTKVPYYYVADFESSIDPTTQVHIPMSWGLKGICYKDVPKRPGFNAMPDPPLQMQSHPDPNTVISTFFEAVYREAIKVWQLHRYRNVPMQCLTKAQAVAYKEALQCCYCGDPFVPRCKKYKKVRDHDHFTGEYRGPAHAKCNLHVNDYGTPLYVFMHNLKSYDVHHLVSYLHRWCKDHPELEPEFKPIAVSSEKYICLDVKVNNGIHIQFKDSMSFMQSSLDAQVELCRKSHGLDAFKHTCKYMRQTKGILDNDVLMKLLQKGYLPYEYIDSHAKLAETQLPPRPMFYSKLTQKHISEEAYQHAQEMWTLFGCETLGDYLHAYLALDVLLLADTFETYRNKLFDSWIGLDPVRYMTMPSFAWDAVLKHSGVCLDLITDAEMFKFVERSKRGGISMVSKRHSKANNSGLGPRYDKTKPLSSLGYYDSNSLYPWAMKQPLPVEEFTWLEEHAVTPENVFEYLNALHDTTGLFLEVDLKVPHELHDRFNDYPLAPEHMIVGPSDLSPYNKRVLKDAERLHGFRGEKKLVPNLRPKTQYVMHHEHLKFCIQQGLRVVRVHRVMQFRQRPWMKSYIECCEEERRNAKNDYEAQLWKDMMNIVFGKTIENVRKRINVSICTTPKTEADIRRVVKKLSHRPQLEDVYLVNEDTAIVRERRFEVLLDKPIIVGCSILELSKVLMARFWYELKDLYQERIALLATDTDSIIVEVQTDDLVEDMGTHFAHHMDFSNYPKDHKFYNTNRARAPGYFKDELKGQQMLEFCGLKPKLYAYVMKSDASPSEGLKGKEVKRIKGITKSARDNLVQFQTYKDVLDTGSVLKLKQVGIKSRHHEMRTVEFEKVGMSAMDNKRWLLEDGIHSYAHGHWRITEEEN